MSPSRGGGWSGGWPEHRPRLPGPGPRRPGRRPFGATWWGQAWVEALELRASLDPNRLPRGRTYARSGAVGELDLGVGQVAAFVQGSRRTPYKVTVRVRTFEAAGWDAVLDAFAARIGHAAALLDGEFPPEVAADASGAGFDLLPGPGEIQPRCSCPDWADPCKHSAAVCYLVADALDADPFGILLLRGRTRAEVLAGLRARRSSPGPAREGAVGSPAEHAPDRGVPAAGAWLAHGGGEGAAGVPVLALPLVPLPPATAGRPSLLVGEPPPGAGVELEGLRAVAADDARRALDLAAGGDGHGLDLTLEADLARRAAAMVGPETGAGRDLAGLAARAGLSPRQLLRRGLAWRAGEAAALDTLEASWDPPPAAVAAGRALLGGRATARRNRLTAGDLQLRLGRDGLWYPYRRASDGGFEPDGPGSPGGGLPEPAEEDDAEA